MAAADTEAQATATPVDGGNDDQDNQRHLKVGSYDISIDNEKMPLLGVAASAIVLLIAIGIGSVEKKMRNYGFSLGAIALIIGILGLVPTNDVTDKYSLYLNYFLFLWCFIGACVMTFGDGPFTITGNGYFASWALAVFSTMCIGLSKLKMPENFRRAYAGMNVILGLGACAVVTMIACIPEFSRYYFQFKGETVFALIVSILTIFVVANFVYAKMKENLQIQQFEVPTFMVLAMLWMLAACMTTFRGPFTLTGNGYFAVWGGAVLAVKAAMSAKTSGSQEEE